MGNCKFDVSATQPIIYNFCPSNYLGKQSKKRLSAYLLGHALFRYSLSMIDLAVIRQDPQKVKQSQQARGESVELVDQVLEADVLRRAAVGEFESLRAEQKSLGALVA